MRAPVAPRRRRLWPLCLALAGCRARPAAEAPPPPPHPPGQVWLAESQVRAARLEVRTLTRRAIANEVVTAGRVTFDDQRVSHVYSPVTGRVVTIDAALGQKVRRGDRLAAIESPDLGQFSADVDKARAAFIAAENDFKRMQALYQAHAGAQRDFEAAQDTFLKAKAELDRAQQKAGLLLSADDDDEAAPRRAAHRAAAGAGVNQHFVLRAPIDGEVVARAVNPGMEIQGQYSGGGTAVELFTVGSLDSVWVVGELFEMDMARVQRGQAARISVVAYPDVPFTGSVEWVSDALDPNSRTAAVRFVVPNPDARLKPEMFATLAIDALGAEAPVVPRSGVFHLGGKTWVFVQSERGEGGQLRFERREVRVDEDVAGDLLPVRAGVQPDDRVVTAGGILLADLL